MRLRLAFFTVVYLLQLWYMQLTIVVSNLSCRQTSIFYVYLVSSPIDTTIQDRGREVVRLHNVTNVFNLPSCTSDRRRASLSDCSTFTIDCLKWRRSVTLDPYLTWMTLSNMSLDHPITYKTIALTLSTVINSNSYLLLLLIVAYMYFHNCWQFYWEITVNNISNVVFGLYNPAIHTTL